MQDTIPRTLGQWLAEFRSHRRRRLGADRLVPLTRADLARRTGISEPTLLRVEQDRELARREVLEAIIAALELFPWQARLLRNFWIGRALPRSRPGNLLLAREIATRLLVDTFYPAFVLDRLHYAKAWNGPAGALLGLDEGGGSPHLLLAALDPQAQQRWGTFWHHCTATTLRHFLVTTALHHTDAGYEVLVSAIEQHPALHWVWRATIHSDGPTPAAPGERLSLALPDAGELEFVVLSGAPPLDDAFAYYVYLPVRGSEERYRRALARLGGGAVHYSDDWRATEGGQFTPPLPWHGHAQTGST
jgi:transcriptional regulator with XRE-family HTH domain